MAQKILKTKRVYVYAIYNSLRSTPPKDYPTTEEIKTTITEILPAFKTHISEYLEMIKKAEYEWENRFNTHLNGLNQKIDHLNKSEVKGSWGLGKSFNSMLSKRELDERNGFVGKE